MLLNEVQDLITVNAKEIKFSIKDFFSKCDQIPRKMRIWSHLLKKSKMGNFIFCAVSVLQITDAYHTFKLA